MRDRFPLLVLATLLFLGAGGYFLGQTARRGQFAEPLSTYRSAPDGARAMFLLAVQAGVKAERRHVDLRDLEPKDGAVVLLGIETLAEKDVEKLQAFVTDGGRLLIVAGEERKENGLLASLVTSQRKVLEAFNVELAAADSPKVERRLEPAVASPLTRGVEALDARVAGYLGRKDNLPFLTVLSDPHAEDKPVAIAFAHGGGRVLVVASPDLASNRVLARADNARFWVGALRVLAGDQRIQFDEFHHGFTGERSISEYAARHGMHWALAQLLLAVWLWVAALRRFGRPRPVARDERSARGDYLIAMARIYRRGGHREHAAKLLVHGLARTLSRKAGLDARATPGEVAEGLALRGREDLASAMTSAARAGTAACESDGALLALARTSASARKLADATPADASHRKKHQPTAVRALRGEKAAPVASTPRTR